MCFCLNDSVPVSLMCSFMWKSSVLGQSSIQTSGSQSSMDVASHFFCSVTRHHHDESVFPVTAGMFNLYISLVP